jgi:hypothetical protein
VLKRGGDPQNEIDNRKSLAHLLLQCSNSFAIFGDRERQVLKSFYKYLLGIFSPNNPSEQKMFGSFLDILAPMVENRVPEWTLMLKDILC